MTDERQRLRVSEGLGDAARGCLGAVLVGVAWLFLVTVFSAVGVFWCTRVMLPLMDWAAGK